MKTISLIVFILLSVLLSAQTITVKQDGTGDFTTIQAAVDSAQNGDTVLVWPGTYVENIEIRSKSITLGSLTLTTGNESYEYQTIIDGNKTGSCIKTWNWNNNGKIIINGFKIVNGTGSNCGSICGGGIFIEYTNINILNCYISHNTIKAHGGGIYVYNSSAFLSNVTITQNQAYDAGGGIYITEGNIEFDSVNRCNIYENYASIGNDIFAVLTDSLLIYADTFTVQNPDYYYVYMMDSTLNHTNDFTYDIWHHKIEQVSQDLYVSTDGDNSNSGLTPDFPLKTISYALLKIASDSISPDTIHVSPGVYSDSLTGEHFPLNLKNLVTIKGSVENNPVVLDGENKIYLLRGFYAGKVSVSNVTIKNGNGNINSIWKIGGVMINNCPNSIFNNLMVTNNNGTLISAVNIHNSYNMQLNNVTFSNNIGGKAVRTSYDPDDLYSESDTVFFNNCVFYQNFPDTTIVDEALGGGLSVNSGQYFIPNTMVTYLYNCLFYNNHTAPLGTTPGATSIIAFNAGKIFITNSTISDNTSENIYGGNVGVANKYSEITVYNSIFYNNEPVEFYMASYANDVCWLNITHSLVEGGVENIRLLQGNTILNYDTTNLDTDPLFYGGAEFPYNLSDESPCIDAGTLDLPQFILDHMPDTDLAGNPRIFNGKIDMGAYEWNPTVSIKEIPNTKKQIPGLTAAPNPFTTQTIISAKWDKPARINIEIYNNAGLLIKTLQSGSQPAGSCQIIWNGTDNSGHYLPSGIYVVVLRVEGKEVASVKVVKK